ncbi:MAG: hypothetical protein QM768_19035 [Agriterribacter sp.]
MRSIVRNIFWILLPTAMLANNAKHLQKPAVISGRVLQKNLAPVGKCYLFIISGEEEAISDKDGKFTITTWQPFPLTIHAAHAQFKKQDIKIDKPAKDIIVTLEPK